MSLFPLVHFKTRWRYRWGLGGKSGGFPDTRHHRWGRLFRGTPSPAVETEHRPVRKSADIDFRKTRGRLATCVLLFQASFDEAAAR